QIFPNEPEDIRLIHNTGTGEAQLTLNGTQIEGQTKESAHKRRRISQLSPRASSTPPTRLQRMGMSFQNLMNASFRSLLPAPINVDGGDWGATDEVGGFPPQPAPPTHQVKSSEGTERVEHRFVLDTHPGV
ncbi:unnamed protein product, partial [Heterosigma akashiwo]